MEILSITESPESETLGVIIMHLAPYGTRPAPIHSQTRPKERRTEILHNQESILPSLIHITKCLFCNFTVQEQEFEPDGSALTGQVPQRLTDFNLKLLGHIQKGAEFEQKQVQKALKYHQEHGGPGPDLTAARHLAQWQQFLLRTALAQGTAILFAFDTTDPGLNILKEHARWKLHEVTRKFFFTDDMLLEGVQKLNLDLPDQDNVLTLVKGIRDALLEQGPYAPKMEQPVRVIA